MTDQAMDAAVLSTLSALGGTAIGALSTLGSTWMNTRSQARAARLKAEREKREEIYGRFMDELARLYADALNNTGIEYAQMTAGYALAGRIKLYSTEPVADAAASGLRFVVDLALGPKRAPEEMRALMDRPEADVIGIFARACRQELAALR